jgi:hypothetical protein
MFRVTEEAAALAADKLSDSGAPTDAVMRLLAREGGLVFEPGRLDPDDVSFEHEGRPVIALSGALADELSGVALQVERTDHGGRLQLRECG